MIFSIDATYVSSSRTTSWRFLDGFEDDEVLLFWMLLRDGDGEYVIWRGEFPGDNSMILGLGFQEVGIGVGVLGVI